MVAEEEQEAGKVGTRNLRPKKEADCQDADLEIPDADQYIWCSNCNSIKYKYCEEHPLYFYNTEEHKVCFRENKISDKEDEIAATK